MAQKMKVTYNDGTEVEIAASPKAQVMAERFLRQQGGFGSATAIEATVRLAFEASQPGIGNVGYEEWLDKVADVEAICMDCGAAMADPDAHVCPEPGSDTSSDPTPEAPSLTPLSD